jgi:HSP20 family protein
MDPDKDERDRRKKNPFDFFGFDDDFERMFREMERMMERAFRFPMDKMEPGKSFVHGFSVRLGPDGRPRIQEFGNHHVKSGEGEATISEEREPLTDVIECDEEVSVTVELPGVEKRDIDLRATEKALEISVDTPQRKYHKIVSFNVEVKPETTRATYKNGVLDVSIQRKNKKNVEDKGVHVDIE